MLVKFKALNPVLYEGLCHRFGGENNVEVVSPGEEMQSTVRWEHVLGKAHLVAKRELLDSGEEYRVRCDKCKDHRPRLYFNHRWGVLDKETGSKNLWLANCYNESCYNDYEAQQHLYHMIYEVQHRGTVQLLPGRIVAQVGLCEVAPPGPMWRLDELARRDPDHPALLYLQERRFDTDYLGAAWDVSYCPVSRYSQASNRIIIPIYADGVMVGWQARYIGDNVNGTPFNVAGVPKYWSSPGFHRRLAAYNFDRAVRHPTSIIVEGPADVWRVGPMALGLIGKTMSPHLVEKYARAMDRHGRDAVVVILLDSKPDVKAKARLGDRYVHHIEKLMKVLWTPLQRRVVDVWLPEDIDAGDMDRRVVRDVIREACAKRNLRASFSAPRVPAA